MPKRPSDNVEDEAPKRKYPKRAKQDRNYEVYFDGPHYELINSPTGGKYSYVTLGPGIYGKYNGTDADSNLPSGIKKAREKYPECSFKAGHLLNAILGGVGTHPQNLTILTAKANSSMRAFDNNIIYATSELKKLYEFLADKNIKISDVKYGIKVEVKVGDDKWGEKIPDSYIAKEITCTAAISGNLQNLKPVDGYEGEVIDENNREIIKINAEIKRFLTVAERAKSIDNSHHF